jgi:hypothetical protein
VCPSSTKQSEAMETKIKKGRKGGRKEGGKEGRKE